jgi:hypothetical protein
MQRQKEREEAEYCYIRIATNQIMSYYTRFDLVNFSDIQPIRIKRVSVFYILTILESKDY